MLDFSISPAAPSKLGFKYNFFFLLVWFFWGGGLFVCLFVLPFRPKPAAYRSSQARGRIGAAVTAYTTATATSDPSRVCDLHSSRQRRILHPLIKARD